MLNLGNFLLEKKFNIYVKKLNKILYHFIKQIEIKFIE